MKRSAIARKPLPRRPERQWTGPTPGMEPRRATMSSSPQAVAVPKDNPARSEAYRRLVAALPCIYCGAEGRSQAAHAPSLGRGIKADDRETFPLCADGPGYVGHHALFDQYSLFSRQARAHMSAHWAESTRAQIVAAGAWPQGLELWQS